MAARSIAALTLSFGLVSIPVKLYSATESTAAIRFKLMGTGGSRLRQQYVADRPAAAESRMEEQREDEELEEPVPAPTSRRPAPTPPDTASTRREPALTPGGAPAQVVDFPAARRDSPVSATWQQQPVPSPVVIERSEMVKGYEFEKGRFVLFTADELKGLEDRSRQTIDIVAFMPIQAIDPIYYSKAYFLAPDKRGAKAYNLLLRAMRDTGRCALAKWAFRSKEYVVQVRPSEGGMVLQQLLYSDEVRSLAELHIEQVDVGDAELALAKQIIEQSSVERYDPAEYVDEEKKRILAAVEEKIAGKQIVSPDAVSASERDTSQTQVVDLLAALRASLRHQPPSPASMETTKVAKPAAGERKPLKRATAKSAPPATPVKRPASKR